MSEGFTDQTYPKPKSDSSPQTREVSTFAWFAWPSLGHSAKLVGYHPLKSPVVGVTLIGGENTQVSNQIETLQGTSR